MVRVMYSTCSGNEEVTIKVEVGLKGETKLEGLCIDVVDLNGKEGGVVLDAHLEKLARG